MNYIDNETSTLSGITTEQILLEETITPSQITGDESFQDLAESSATTRPGKLNGLNQPNGTPPRFMVSSLTTPSLGRFSFLSSSWLGHLN